MKIGILLIGVLLGVILGYKIAKDITSAKSVGCLRIDRSDPDDGPYLFLELKTDPQILEKKEFVTLKVDTKSFISQE